VCGDQVKKRHRFPGVLREEEEKTEKKEGGHPLCGADEKRKKAEIQGG